jgi:hypothetical protein
MQNINMLQMITVVAAKLRLKEESFPYYSCFQLFMVANLKLNSKIWGTSNSQHNQT